ncbi:MAG TPA: hypothetical protein VG056_13670, partial [Pirellulales bacterium]|nr:hypothetical protein [Pirellulales bacterium]
MKAMPMGMRYDLELTVNLKENAPESVVRFVAFLMGESELPPPDVPDHPFGADLSVHKFADWATSCEPHAGE